MSKVKLELNEIDDNVYINRKSFYFKIICLGFLLFFLGLFSSLPVRETIENKIAYLLQSNPNCKISQSGITIGFFMPEILINKIKLPMSCLNPRSPNREKIIEFKTLKFSFDSPSFSPFGIRTRLLLKTPKGKINIYPTISFGGLHFTIKDTLVESKLIGKLVDQGELFKGHFTLNGVITANMKEVQTAKLHLKSKNFQINKAKIQGFELKKLDIKNISLKLWLKSKSNLIIKQLIIGNKTSPIIANIKGKVKLNQKTIKTSKLDINAEFKFSEKFNQDYPFIKLFIKGKKDSSGFYNLKLDGTIGRPNPPKFI